MALENQRRENIDGVTTTPTTVHRETVEARQGESTGRVSKVLLISIVVAVLAMVVVFVVWKAMR